MRYLLSASLLFIGVVAKGQTIKLPSGDYMDTTSTRQSPCATAPLAHYYSVEGKYPRSSDTLVREAEAFLKQQKQGFKGTGYVTFRFVVDCAGHRLPRTQVLQADAQYQRATFQPDLLAALYAFLQTLTEWKVAKRPSPTNYIAYLTFKLKDGQVVAVVP
jgi:hypothetical protein